MTDGERISSSELLRRYEAGERNFQRVILQETNLQGANLWGIILWEANLWGTDLRNANLQKADLRGAILEKVDQSQKLMADSNKQNNFHAPVGSVDNQGHIGISGNQNTTGNAAGEVKGDQKSIQHIHNLTPEKQTLAEAAAEIQKLLKQLEQTNPTATEAQQIEHINDETTPKFKRRVVGALQATGEAAIDEFILENKYLKIAKSAIKGWLKPE